MCFYPPIEAVVVFLIHTILVYFLISPAFSKNKKRNKWLPLETMYFMQVKLDPAHAQTYYTYL